MAGVLLGPQFSEQVGDPAVDRPEPVEPRVAGPAEGDQSGRGVGGGAVMHDERIRSQADAAQVAVTRQDPFPAPAEAGAGAAGAVVAGLAEPAAVEIRRSAGAAQGELFLKVGGHGGEARYSELFWLKLNRIQKLFPLLKLRPLVFVVAMVGLYFGRFEIAEAWKDLHSRIVAAVQDSGGQLREDRRNGH